MKGALLFIAIFALSMLVIPMIALNYEAETPNRPAQAQLHDPTAAISGGEASQSDAGTTLGERSARLESSSEPQSGNPAAASPSPAPESADVEYTSRTVSEFLILDESTGQVERVALRDYLRGAVAAEMPAGFHPEALKAQAVAAHSFALHNHLVQRANPDPTLKGADFSADPSNMKVYITEATARDFYGGKADELWEKICDAADSVEKYLLEYDEQPIVAAYHAISAGQTEDAANLWIGSAPYLLSVESGGDLLAPDYETQVEFGADELRDAFREEYPDIEFQADTEQWFGRAERSPSGYVGTVEVGDALLHGKDVRRVLDLRSHCFDVEYTGAGFRFTVYGYGHGVGLSQYGADFMARQGADFREILAHYYPGAKLAEASQDP